nr:reverse transcriptase domain-containing protein [Tanacetum cinerariifolium]
MLEVRKELKICEAHSEKSLVDEPHVAKLKELPLHLEYAFLEGDDKLPVIIAKDLSVEEKTALITILKSHKRAIAWRISDIKGINPEFCTYKILMEEDFEPAVQHQRKVNPKIYDVIKQEVIKLLEAGLIYPISDSPWVRPMHCVPKKGGFTVVENKDNKLIPTRLVTGWRVCIDYRKLNEATRLLARNQSSNPSASTNPNSKGRNRRRSKQMIINLDLDDLSSPVVMMADQRTMAQFLQAPIEGYEDAIIVPAITVDNFELKHGLLTHVQNKQFFEHDKEDPHAHVCYFNKITSTLKFPSFPNTSIKLMLFPFSLEGTARIWLEKEPPRSIFTWDDLVLKFINKFFPPSKTTNLRNEITNFQQRFDESFSEAWDRFKDLLRACPHHGFSELHQIDTFYNALNSKDQDSLNSAVG